MLMGRGRLLASSLLGVAVLCLAACGSGSDGTAATDPAAQARVTAVETSAAFGSAAPPDNSQGDMSVRQKGAAKALTDGPVLDLGPVSADERAAYKAAPTGGAPLIGIHRTAGGSKSGTDIQWSPTPEGGFQGVLTLRSREAAGIRVGLVIQAVPDLAVVATSSPAEATERVASGQQINQLLQANALAKETGEAALTWWAPVVAGDVASVSIRLPSGVPVAAVQIRHIVVSHLFELPGPTNLLRPKSAAACNLDAPCYDTLDIERRTTALLLYSTPLGTGVCSGTLMIDKVSSWTPYVLTASHCFTTQSAASSLETYWFYESQSCNSADLRPVVANTGGAKLLFTSAKMDATFVKLNQAAPAGAYYSGWFAGDPPPGGTQIAGVHHPNGERKKVSFGGVVGTSRCTLDFVAGTTACTPEFAGAGTHITVLYSQGTVEGGSSGSGLWGTREGKRVLIGQLTSGGDICAASGTRVNYGRFDMAFAAGVGFYLAPTQATPATVSAPQTGWWWVPTQSGTGFAVERRGENIYVAGFMYDTNGRDVWYSAALKQNAKGDWSGDLRNYVGGNNRAFSGTARPPTGSTPIATLELNFSSATTGSMRIIQGANVTNWSFGRFPVAPSGTGSSTAGFENGWWYSAAESGHGYFIEVQGTTVLAATYSYNDAGEAAWYLHQGKLAGANQFSANVDRYSGGQTLAGAYKAPTAPTSLGTMTFTASSATTGALRLPSGAVVNLQRFVF